MLLGTSACAPTQKEFGIELADLNATTTSNGLNIRARQEVKLSHEARNALKNGVPLRVRLDVAIQDSDNWAELGSDSLAYEIRYLPLSDHYQLTGPGANESPQTFPRLRHVLAEIRGIEWRIGDIEIQPGDYKIKMRSQLDRAGMPGPMQLPMLFSSDWNHDSGWVAHEFQVRG